MSEHRFELPDNQGPSQWEQISPAAQEALMKHGENTGDASKLTGTTIPAILELPKLYDQWARGGIANALELWKIRSSALGIHVPSNIEELARTADEADSIYSLVDQLGRLYNGRVFLDESPFADAFGQKLSENMRLTLVPWQLFKDNLPNLEQFVTDLAACVDQPIDINPRIFQSIQDEEAMYHEIESPYAWTTAKRYLDLMIERSGPWGVMLTQTGEPGALNSVLEQPVAYKGIEGDERFRLAGIPVDAMGIFELLATYIQDGSSSLVGTGTWLPANRIKGPFPNAAALQPYCYQAPLGPHLEMEVGLVASQGEEIQLRLTVL